VQGAGLPIRDSIHISVEVVYAEGHSRPGQHVFVYFITLENRGHETVQLLSREWFIHDGDGKVGHVQGEGVVGEKPVLEPGQSYQYNSFCPIAHPPGSMRGYYTFQNTLGELFLIEIPTFALRLPPQASRTLN
jgi:ApaG protein